MDQKRKNSWVECIKIKKKLDIEWIKNGKQVGLNG